MNLLILAATEILLIITASIFTAGSSTAQLEAQLMEEPGDFTTVLILITVLGSTLCKAFDKVSKATLTASSGTNRISIEALEFNPNLSTTINVNNTV